MKDRQTESIKANNEFQVVSDWNNKYPIGTIVLYQRSIHDKPIRTKTTGPARVFVNCVMVDLEGLGNNCLLEHVEVRGHFQETKQLVMDDRCMYLTNIKELIESQPCPFAENTLIYPANLEELKPFLIHTDTNEMAAVDLNQITGTLHGAYAGKPWKYLIYFGKKAESNLKKLETTPGYYLSNQKKDINLIKIMNEYFIDGSGNNRAVIAKFFFYYNQKIIGHSLLNGVTITEWHVDYSAYANYNTIRNTLKEKGLNHITIGHSIKPSSQKKTIFLHNDKANISIHLDHDKLEEVASALERDSFLKRVIGVGYHKYFRRGLFA